MSENIITPHLKKITTIVQIVTTGLMTATMSFLFERGRNSVTINPGNSSTYNETVIEETIFDVLMDKFNDTSNNDTIVIATFAVSFFCFISAFGASQFLDHVKNTTIMQKDYSIQELSLEIETLSRQGGLTARVHVDEPIEVNQQQSLPNIYMHSVSLRTEESPSKTSSALSQSSTLPPPLDVTGTRPY